MKALLVLPIVFSVLLFSCTENVEEKEIEKESPPENSETTAEAKEEKTGGREFESTEGDTTYVMKEYFMCFLNEGPVRDQDSTATAQIQAGHLAHLDSLAKAGKIHIVGPFGDEGKTRGIAIYNTATKEEAVELASMDPAVKSGRLLVEIRPWWAAKGSALR
jgi:uncharacterized protein YciI